MNINEAITNEKLVDVMRRLKQNSANQEGFFKEVYEAKFLCPVNMELKDTFHNGNKIVTGEGTSISLMSLVNNEGQHFLMAFTDWEELRKWNKKDNQKTLVLTCDDYRNAMRQPDSPYQGMVINPYGENIILSLSLLNNIKKNEYVAQKAEKVMIGIPSEYPVEMVNMLSEYFGKNNNVFKSYLLWMVRGEEASYLLVLDSKVPSNQLFPHVGEMCHSFLKGELLDIVSANSAFGKSVIENQTPFFIN